MPPPDRLRPATVRAVDDAVAAAQATGRVPTLVAAVVRNGRLAHLAAAGNPTTVGGHPPTDAAVLADLQFRIGSITKTFTAALLMRARDEGRLRLDDPLHRHLPDPPLGGVTLRQLLGHASGLRREPDGAWWERSPGSGPATLLAGLTPDTLARPPWRGHHYSNLAFGLLGEALSRATGRRWVDLVADHLLAPLGMRRTTYHPVEPYARGFVVHPWHGTTHEQPRADTGAMAPAGQLWSTAADLARWAGFLTDPDPAVLDPATLAEMCVPVTVADPEAWTGGHGLGIQLWRVGERVFVGHSGSMPGYLAVLAAHRRSGTAVVAFADAYTLHGSAGLAPLGTDLLATVLDLEPPATVPWRPGGPPPTEVTPLCGQWWWMGQEFLAGWDAAGAELVVTPRSRPDLPWRFTRDGPDRWRGTAGGNEDEVLAVRRDADGGVVALDIATCRFTRDPDASL